MFLLISTFSNISKAIVCSKDRNTPSNTINVDKSGTGNFATVQAAVDSVPAGNSQWIRISVKPGLYNEKVTIPVGKEFIYLEGCGYSQTVIAWNDHGQTDTSATFSVWPDNFVAKGIAFQNFYNTVLEATGGQERTPALAIRIYGDKSAFHECGFIGFQDTVWDVKGRHYFKSCYIEGAVDFIWGGGQSFYEDCTVNVTAGMLPRTVAAGFITAQGRQSAADPSGFVFERGSVSGTGQAYLGRAYGPYSRVIFHGTTFDSVVFPLGWDAWHYQGTENNFMYVEAGCQGPGADTSKRVSWEKKDLVGSQLQEFSRDVFINQDGWLGNQPQTTFLKV
ncbi:putative pectinesterase 52 [Actinidia eriantha]|uniref:putative pectinesterase 52 n=1 Tax=Actinidia eriantha TaxID=165200 RepID=UPI002589A353|nr:putative pectinesterase 52 [Actinidia eriantha]